MAIRPDKQRVVSALLRWYRQNYRRLPWRAPPAATATAGRRRLAPDPYHVLLSEIMLQQTQVATVIPYFERFVAALPTVGALAAAGPRRVLCLWQGLGYYRRALRLHAAARAIVARHQGRVPSDPTVLRRLPGIGPYTAGAVASIAFDRPVAAVDGNVARVLGRLYGIQAGSPPARRVWELAQALLPARGCGDVNQALMELGARVCLARAPRCAACCLRDACGGPLARPLAAAAQRARRRPRRVCHHMLAITRDGKYLFEQRPDAGLWARMWQMPTVELGGCRAISRMALRRRIEVAWGLKIAGLAKIGEFEHPTTHRAITFTLWKAQAVGRAGAAGVWCRLPSPRDLAVSRAQERAMVLLEGAVHGHGPAA